MLTVIKVNSNYWKAFIIKVTLGDPTPKGKLVRSSVLLGFAAIYKL